MTENFHVSVVIPTYRRPEKTHLAVQTVIEQSLAPIEIIVVDDHSPEGEFAQLVSLVGHQATIVRADHNGGPGAARNFGVEAATGEWIAFLDSDDRWAPTYLAAVARAFHTRAPAQGVSLIHANCAVINAEGKIRRYTQKQQDQSEKENLLGWNCIGSASCVTVRRSEFLAAGGSGRICVTPKIGRCGCGSAAAVTSSWSKIRSFSISTARTTIFPFPPMSVRSGRDWWRFARPGACPPGGCPGPRGRPGVAFSAITIGRITAVDRLCCGGTTCSMIPCGLHIM